MDTEFEETDDTMEDTLIYDSEEIEEEIEAHDDDYENVDDEDLYFRNRL